MAIGLNDLGTVCVIPAAGQGTRLRPMSAFVPKELLPVGGVPALVYALAEAVTYSCPIRIVTREGATDTVSALCDEYLPSITARPVDIAVSVQTEPIGLVDAAVLSVVAPGVTRFVLLPDEIAWPTGELGRRMLAVRERHGGTVLTVRRLADGLRAEKGEARLAESDPCGSADSWRVLGTREGGAESLGTLSITGRYLLAPEMARLAREVPKSARGELEMCDLLNLGIARGLAVRAVIDDGIWFDLGTPEAYAQAVVDVHLQSLWLPLR